MFNSSSNKIEREFENLRNELLDLTLRNQLLNFKLRAKTIAIENQSCGNIFQNLVLQNKKMYFESNKKDENKEKSRFSIWDHSPIDFSKYIDGDRTLRTDLTPTELQKRLFYINNQAKTMLQEQGYNILYLAVGFLEWKDNKKPQKNLAPLVLIPVTMERKKVGKSFQLSWTGEEIQTNISLKAKLKEDGIKLPDFEFKRYSEVIDHYIKKVDNVTRHMKGWKVNSDIALGFFSFTKFVMYNDLNPESWEDNVDLTKKELIQAIFNPEVNNQEAFKEEDIDSQLDYGSMYQVLDADSSQIAVIEDVKAGRNLVVEGPPGTGKSQTIVNLIAELLAEGKTVLFVSEKMAALEVVKDRLQSVGLGKFVLELHSHKTRRKKFLKDLKKAVNVRPENPINADETIRKLDSLKKQLDDYPEVIHQKYYGVNLSPFELFGMKEDAEVHFVKKDKILPLVRFEKPELVTIKDLDDMVFKLESVAELYQTISKENPWSLCAPKSLLPADLREIELLIIDCIQALDNFIIEKDFIHNTFGIKSPESLSEFSKSLKAFKLIESKKSSLIDSSIITSKIWKLNNNDPYKLIEDLELYQGQSKILSKFNDNILKVDIDKLIRDVTEVSNKKFRLFNNNKKKIESIVGRYYQRPVPDSNQVVRDLNTAKVAINLKHKIERNDGLAKQYFGEYWHLGANTNDLKSITTWMKEFWALVDEGIFSTQTIDLLSKDLFNINASDNLSSYISLGEDFKNKLSRLDKKLNPRSKLIFKRDTADVTFDQWKKQLNNWRGQLSSLHLWSQYLNTKNSLNGTDSELFIDVIEKRNILKDDVKALVFGNFADSLLNVMFLENQQLATFIGELHENKISEFKKLDKDILELNRKRIIHKLNSNIPNIFGGALDNQAQILAGEFTRKSGHLPVRKLLQKAGGLIKKIKPVFMMSPLSIAQYLDPTNEELQFDVVIFDEASQVKPQDALGAFMRAKTAVVMGDTQQLPPTSFFEQMADGESYEEEATSLDMESILHLCKLSFPVKMLKWHYRSRHESLISVSNEQFYDNELLVYPSPSHIDPELGLKLHYNPNTCYDRGSSSANVGEAKDVVKAIFEHFDTYGDTKSLGVGTFSVAQKNAILEELELQRKYRPELEPLFSENNEERFFVKNLETIQGDERDVILISVGYGHDEEGKMSLNFGPLNQEGGERRLNVLITRAREKCVVFSNFKSHDMHLSNNPPFGVKSLKEFLHYAENITLGNQVTKNKKQQKFEDSIAKFLEEKGYIVARQVGSSGFKVDLALIDEENPGQYFLGITTDGEMYASSKVARDRNRLREQVLEGLGWNIYHLWSTDWYRNRELGRKKLLSAIADAKVKYAENKELKAKEAEKIKLEAEKRAEELRKAQEEEKAKEEMANEFNDETDDITIIDPNDSDDAISSTDSSLSEEDSNSVIVEDDDFIYVEHDNSSSNSSINNESSASSDGFIYVDHEGDSGSSSGGDDFIYVDHEGDSGSSSGGDDFIYVENDDSSSNSNNEFENYDGNGTIFTKKENNSKSKKGKGFRDSIKSVFKINKDDIESNISDNFDNGLKSSDDLENNININDNYDDDLNNHKEDNISPRDSNIKFKKHIEKDIKNNPHDFNKPSNNSLEEEFESEEDLFGEEISNDEYNQSEEGKEILFDDEFSEDDEGTSFDDTFNQYDEDYVDEIQDSSNDNHYFEDEFPNDNSKSSFAPNSNDETFGNESNSNEYGNVNYAHSVIKNKSDAKEINFKVKGDDEKKGFLSSIADNLKDGETKLNVSGNKVYDDNLNEKYIPEVEVNNDPQKTVEKEVHIVDVAFNSPDGNVYDKDEETRKKATRIVDKVFDDILSESSKEDYSKHDNEKLNNESFDQFNETVVQDEYNYDDGYREDDSLEYDNDYDKINDTDYSNELGINKDSVETEIDKTQNGDEAIVEETKIVDYKTAKNIAVNSSTELYDKSIFEVSDIVKGIVEVEGPIHVNELIKRIRESCEIKRAGAKFKKTINDAIEISEQSGDITKIDDFLFNDLDKNINIRKRIKPNIDLISQAEIEKNIELILAENKSLNISKIAKEAANNFGFKSTSKKTANRINSVLDLMIVDGKVIVKDDVVELN